MSEQATDTNGTATERPAAVPADLSLFVNALFLPTDLVLIRPIETWVEKGTGKKHTDKKRSQVIYKKVRHIQASRLAGELAIWRQLLKVAEDERANLFFGVCPRFGGDQKFDLAWQIRTVRGLWADIDYCDPAEALNRSEAAGLPRPSVVISSGNGVHLYWFLAEPYLIDDVGEPPPVRKEFQGKGERPLLHIPGPDKAKAKAKAERIYEYLDEGKSDQKNPDWPTLSPKGRHVQDVLAGVAAKIGGDHTQDVSRLLRLPCTLNRKDQCNGKQPVPCELVECALERRYPFADFERFSEAAPDRVRVQEAAKVRLPKGRKLTTNRLNKLNDFINASALSGVGDRSEPDFALCAWAIEQGIDREEVWPQLVDVGKFGERGRDYFDLTWGKAEDKVRQKVYDRAYRKAAKTSAAGVAGANGTHAHTSGVGTVPGVLGLPPADEDGDESAGGGFTEVWNARRLVLLYGQSFRHCHPWQKDLVWDGRRWREDDTAQLERWAKRTIREMYREAADSEDSEWAMALAEHAVKSEEARRIRAMMSLARSEPNIPILPAEMDRDPWLFNCENGTIDLRTGELREHRQQDRLTKLCPTEYRPETACPTFLRFLPAVFGDNDLVVFVQRLLGRCLTGDISEQVLPIFWGTGANGKSTLLNAVMETMGRDYAMKASADMLMVSRGERHPTELAQLFGKRLVVASESSEGRQLNEALIKDLTGGEPIRARRMREDFWEFDPLHKIIFVTNHKPGVRGTDDGIWRRLRLVPFTVRFWDPNEPGCPDSTPPEALQDKQLPDKLRAEYPGILAWMVRGCLDWQREGLTLPEKVQAATADYRSTEDHIAQFLAEACLTGPDYRSKAGALFDLYRMWCEKAGEVCLKQRAFGEAMTERGFQREKNNVIWYIGVAPRLGDETTGERLRSPE